ncbi:MAG: mechanosensitive ion channel [Anaerofustis stercorihominis]|nr:mechanosensitive ion channel [Anaerofustis stercorihominis]
MKQDISLGISEAFGGLFSSAGVLSVAKLITAAAVVVFVWLVCTVICFILGGMEKKGGQKSSMAGLFGSLTKFVCAIIALVWALGVLGVNVAGIFASLGIASLIIGFGAQSLIEDAITGIFIIFEGQYNVGDIIVLDEFRGTVRKIGVRTTSIEDSGGNLKIVNNSDIRNLQNRSRNVSVAVCDVGISYDEDINRVEDVIKNNIDDIYRRNKNIFLSAPKYAGVETLADSCVVLRLTVDVTEENFFVGKRLLNKEIKLLFDANNIEIPFSQLVVHNA